MAGKLKVNEVKLVSPNGLVEKSITMDNSGVVYVDGKENATIESGTFVLDTSTWSVQPTYKNGKYVKIGKLVNIQISINGGTFENNDVIGGLPYPIITGGTVQYYDVNTLAGKHVGVFSTNANTSISYLNATTIGTDWIHITGFYFTN